jgi:hypothetical protein
MRRWTFAVVAGPHPEPRTKSEVCAEKLAVSAASPHRRHRLKGRCLCLETTARRAGVDLLDR